MSALIFFMTHASSMAPSKLTPSDGIDRKKWKTDTILVSFYCIFGVSSNWNKITVSSWNIVEF